MRGFTRDEGGPLGVGLQDQASSRPKLLGTKSPVVSVSGKGAGKLRQARIRKTNEIEPSMTCRNALRRRRNREEFLFREKVQGEPVDCLGGVRHKDGVILIQALVRNMGTCGLDGKGEIQAEDP